MTQSAPTDLNELSQAGAEALRRRAPGTARPLFERVVSARPADAGAWFGLALACRDLGDGTSQLAALDQVLAIDANHLPSLLMKADHFASSGDSRAAASFYRAVVARAPPIDSLPPDLRDGVRRAERLSKQQADNFEAHLRGALAAAGFDPSKSSPRFSQSLDLLLGKKQIYLQSPTAFYFPELPQRQFYERGEFPWLTELEAKTDTIRDELSGVIHDDHALRPYVRSDATRPPKEFGDLRDSRDWSAFFLIEDGAVVADAAARCPRTMEALSAVPLAQTPGRTPSVLFSLLRPKTRIPPHTGMINTRLICHLPLIVPGGCALRVGNEVRPWIKGEALIFDDTIEHEAWNDSDELRVVLLFDIWRPELSPAERGLVSALLTAVDTYGAGRPEGAP
ncbi:MAG: aspartyl/asparaginyl beta-hydroxylase domain-containing protein [Caulobacteraceae bacterium]